MFSKLLDVLIRADQGLFLLINGAHSSSLDGLMFLISKTWIWIPLYLVMLFSLIRQERVAGLISIAFLAAAIGLADQVSVHGFKEVFERLRPCHDPDLRMLVHTVNGKCGGIYGFVSSHAANVFAVLTFFLYAIHQQRKIWAVILPFYAILVCYSRVYLGVHYPGDILGGAILGSGVGLSLGFLHSKVIHHSKVVALLAGRK
jgi:undecaprenyl-diphosphatase